MNKKDTAMKALGFTEEWLTQGVLTEGLLLELYAQIQVSENKHQEHYRCHALSYYLSSKESLTDTEISLCFKLKDDGEDLCDLTENRIYDVLNSGLLSDKQLSELSAHYPFIDETPFQRLYRRLCLARDIQSCGLTEAIFEKVKQSQDPVLHLMALEHKQIQKEQMSWLSEYGNNKSIRNVARTTLNSKRVKYLD